MQSIDVGLHQWLHSVYKLDPSKDSDGSVINGATDKADEENLPKGAFAKNDANGKKISFGETPRKLGCKNGDTLRLRINAPDSVLLNFRGGLKGEPNMEKRILTETV